MKNKLLLLSLAVFTIIGCKKEEPKKEIVLKHILQLAKELGLLTCFEGIESEVELTYTRELGPDCLQGFYFSHALSFADFTNKYL